MPAAKKKDNETPTESTVLIPAELKGTNQSAISSSEMLTARDAARARIETNILSLLRHVRDKGGFKLSSSDDNAKVWRGRYIMETDSDKAILTIAIGRGWLQRKDEFTGADRIVLTTQGEGELAMQELLDASEV